MEAFIMECGAVLVLVLAMSLICLRRHRKDYFFAITPIMIVPAAHIAGYYLSRKLAGVIPFEWWELYVFIDIMALLVACISFGFNSQRFDAVRIRRGYLVICGAFTLVFTWILVARILRNIPVS